MNEPTPPSLRRRVITWVASLVGGAAFLWLASTQLSLWPDDPVLVAPWLVVLAVIVHAPYVVVRAMRLSYLLDPVVAAASEGAQPRLNRSVLYGSGLVSFLVLIVLPLKLGELSRPLLLSRAHQPGVGLAEALAAVATERIIDGLVICGMLFGGLALAPELDAQVPGSLADVRAVGQGMLGLFVVGLLGLLLAASAPERATTLAERVLGPRFAALVTRVVEPVRPLLRMRRAVPLVGWSLVYWAITTFQLWLVLRACDIELGAAASAAVVAIVGLSIQLPGGPAQAGTFQVGTGLALGLFLGEAQLQGPGSTFGVVMYGLPLLGSALAALPGLWLLRRAAP
ncbi:MAG: lysylphosphatidylglycerol synthase transmembrane domain-containing protein [Nannocystaceae bacterium]